MICLKVISKNTLTDRFSFWIERGSTQFILILSRYKSLLLRYNSLDTMCVKSLGCWVDFKENLMNLSQDTWAHGVYTSYFKSSLPLYKADMFVFLQEYGYPWDTKMSHKKNKKNTYIFERMAKEIWYQCLLSAKTNYTTVENLWPYHTSLINI